MEPVTDAHRVTYRENVILAVQEKVHMDQMSVCLLVRTRLMVLLPRCNPLTNLDAETHCFAAISLVKLETIELPKLLFAKCSSIHKPTDDYLPGAPAQSMTVPTSSPDWSPW
jgi:hypothetical protein